MGTLRGGQAEGLIVDAAAHVASGAVSVGGARLDAVRRAVAVLLTEGEAHPHTSEAMRRVALRVRGALARALGRGHAALARRRKVAAQLAIAHVAVLIAAAVLLARVRADAAACGEGSRVATAASSAISIRGASAAARTQRLGGYEEDHQAEMSSDLTVVHVEYPRLIPRRDVRHEYGPRNYRGKIVTREAASRQPFSRSEPEEAADRGPRGRERGLCVGGTRVAPAHAAHATRPRRPLHACSLPLHPHAARPALVRNFHTSRGYGRAETLPMPCAANLLLSPAHEHIWTRGHETRHEIIRLAT